MPREASSKIEFLQNAIMAAEAAGSEDNMPSAAKQFFSDELLKESAQMTLLLAVQVPDTDALIAAVQLGEAAGLLDSELSSTKYALLRDAEARFMAWYPSYISELRSRDSWPGASRDHAVRSCGDGDSDARAAC